MYWSNYWATTKREKCNGEVQIQALMDKKKVIITETSIRRDLQLADENGTECLPNATIFAELERMGYENLTQKLTFYKAFFSPQWKFLIHTTLQCLSAKTTAWKSFVSTMASAVCASVPGNKLKECPNIKKIYVTPSHTKKVFANMKRQGKDFSGRDTPLFPTMIVQAQEQKETEDPQLSGPTEPITDDTKKVASVPTHSNDPLLSGEDRLKLNELMELYTSLSQRVLDLEKTKTSQAAKITELKKKVKKLEKKGGSRTYRIRRLYKVGRSARVVSSEDEGLGDQEDASKQRRKINEIDQDAEVTLVDETQGRYSDNLMFDTGVLDNEQDMAEKEVDMAEKDVNTADPVTTAGEVVTTTNVVVSTAEVTIDSTTTTTIDELTLAQTLIEFKAAKPKAIITAAITTITAVTRPKDRGVVVQEPRKMVKPEKPLKKKDHIMFDKEVAQKLQAQLDDELEEEDKLARQREEDANIVEWDNVQAIIDADYELAARLQAEEQGELTIEEKSRLFVELISKRKKHFSRHRAEEQRRKPPSKAQKKNTMSTYLKNMAGYKHNQLKTKCFEDIQMLFDKEMKRVNIFVDMDTELVKGSETRTEGSSKRAREELKSENLKKQKLDENVEAEVDDDQEEAKMKKHMEIVPDDEVAIDAIPLATKTSIIADCKIIKKGKIGYFQIIRADGSLKRYSSMIQML
ncbi:hypothetical protein Tco_0060502 [Tanacetum coccineum]